MHPIFSSLKFLNQKQNPITQIIRQLFNYLRTGEITAMNKGKSIEIKTTKEEMIDIQM